MKRIPLKIKHEANEFVVYDEDGVEVAFFPTREQAKQYVLGPDGVSDHEDGPGEFDFDPDVSAMESRYENYLGRT